MVHVAAVSGDMSRLPLSKDHLLPQDWISNGLPSGEAHENSETITQGMIDEALR